MIERIKKIMVSKQLSPAQFSEKLEINRSNLTHLFSGRNQASLDLAKKILNAFPEINTEWLIMGVGTMQKADFEEADKQPLNKPEVSGELDLFSSIPEKVIPLATPIIDEVELTTQRKKSIPSVAPRESNNPILDAEQSKKIDSREAKKIEKIIFFYIDKTFEAYYP